MKIVTLSIFFSFFIFTALFADINPDEVSQINQRLENIDILYELFWTKTDRDRINKLADEYLH